MVCAMEILMLSFLHVLFVPLLMPGDRWPTVCTAGLSLFLFHELCAFVIQTCVTVDDYSSRKTSLSSSTVTVCHTEPLL